MSTRSDIVGNLETSLVSVKDDLSYPTMVASVAVFDQNVLLVEKYKTPLIIIDDTGAEEIVVRDATHYRKITDIYFRGFVRTDTSKTIHADINKVQAFIEQYVDSSPALGDNVLDFQLVGAEQHRYDDGDGRFCADVVVLTRIIYWQTVGSP